MPVTACRRCLSASVRSLAAALPLVVAAMGCTTVPRAPVLPPQAGAPREAAPAPAASSGSSPWQVPAAAYGSQILYRVAVAGPEGEGSLKLTLRLASPQRYQAQAVDPLGRAVWGLDVEGDRGLWLDHRGHRYCRVSGALDLAFLPLGPLSLSALPPLLLGRLPVPPADPALVSRGRSDTVAYRDAAGRGWSAALRGGQVVSWGLWQDATAAPILSWADTGSWSVLSDRRKGLEVRWREAVREPLRALVPMTPRSDYKQSACAEATAPASPGAGGGPF